MSIMKTHHLLFGIAFAVAGFPTFCTDLAQRLEAQSVSELHPHEEPGSIYIGRLIRSGKTRNGTPKFALLDDEGSISSFVVPAAGLNLSSYVNQQVGVTARSVRNGRDNLPYILAKKVTLLESTNDTRTLPADEAILSSDVLSEPEEFSVADAESFSELEMDEVDEDVPTGAAVTQYTEDMPFDVAVPGEPAILDEPAFDEFDPGIGAPAGDYFPNYSPKGPGCFPSEGCPCGPPGCFWIRGEYILWWTKGMNLPPLVTTSPSNTSAQNAGVLGQSGTQVLFGNGDILDESRSGARVRFGKWCDHCHWIGIEGEYFLIAEESDGFALTSSGAPILARPFFNTQSNAQDSELIAFPGIVAGTVAADTTSELHSFSPRVRINLACTSFCPHPADACSFGNGCGGAGCQQSGEQRLDLLLGYRFYSLDESLSIREVLASTRNGVVSNFDLADAFDTENEFHGGEIGLVFERYRGPWSIELLGKVGLGNTHEVVQIRGSTSSSTSGTSFGDQGGLLALESNMGRFSDDTFVAIPEVSATIGYLIAPSLRFLVGYTFFYWSDVVRPGDQIDLSVNPDLIPPPLATTGPRRPAFDFQETSFWAQGLSFGAEYRW
jgi:hypothetical protein